MRQCLPLTCLRADLVESSRICMTEEEIEQARLTIVETTMLAESQLPRLPNSVRQVSSGVHTTFSDLFIKRDLLSRYEVLDWYEKHALSALHGHKPKDLMTTIEEKLAVDQRVLHAKSAYYNQKGEKQ